MFLEGLLTSLSISLHLPLVIFLADLQNLNIDFSHSSVTFLPSSLSLMCFNQIKTFRVRESTK